MINNMQICFAGLAGIFGNMNMGNRVRDFLNPIHAPITITVQNGLSGTGKQSITLDNCLQKKFRFEDLKKQIKIQQNVHQYIDLKIITLQDHINLEDIDKVQKKQFSQWFVQQYLNQNDIDKNTLCLIKQKQCQVTYELLQTAQFIYPQAVNIHDQINFDQDQDKYDFLKYDGNKNSIFELQNNFIYQRRQINFKKNQRIILLKNFSRGDIEYQSDDFLDADYQIRCLYLNEDTQSGKTQIKEFVLEVGRDAQKEQGQEQLLQNLKYIGNMKEDLELPSEIKDLKKDVRTLEKYEHEKFQKIYDNEYLVYPPYEE